MIYRFVLTQRAKNDLSNLEEKIQIRFAEKLRFYTSSPDPLFYAKKLKNYRFGTYRFRIGDYRAIFDVDNKGKVTILLILRIKHRKEVYE